MVSKGEQDLNRTQSHGRRAVVAVGVSTVWTSPEAPRACDAPAIAGLPDLSAWVTGMTRQQRRDLHGRTLTQLLLGDVVQVDEVANGWARIVAIEQAAPPLDPRGYPGWVPAAHIVPDGEEQPAGEQYVVDAMFSALRERPAATARAMNIVLGTRLTVLGKAQGRYVPVAAPGRPAPLWADLADLAPATSRPAAAARDLLPVALRLQGVPYIWGGVSPHGIDCSGLVYLAHRRLGVAVPRDAADQADASVPVEPGEQAPGHLCFFEDLDARIDHVGLLQRPGQLIHASGGAGQVRQEPIEGQLARRLTAIRRTLP